MKIRTSFLEPTTGAVCPADIPGMALCAGERVGVPRTDLLGRGDSQRGRSDRLREWAESNRTTDAARPLQINRAYYDAYADHFRGRTTAWPMPAVYEPFLRELPPWAQVLDAGCGPGRNAAAFESRGYRVTAIDASPAMVELARRSGVDARVMTFQQIAFKEEFDGIWASASVLHVPRAEIREVLGRFARALKPQGILYVSLKEGQSECIAEDGRFFSYYTLNEFSNLLKSRGFFKVLKAWKLNGLDSSGTIRTWLSFLAARSPGLIQTC